MVTPRSACSRCSVRARPSADSAMRAPGAGRRAGRRRTRLREVVVHLAAHPLDLLVDGRGEIGLAGRPGVRRFLAQHRERRLQAVREVAGLRHRARQRAFAVIEQRVELVDQRLHLGGIGAFDPPLACRRGRRPGQSAAGRACDSPPRTCDRPPIRQPIAKISSIVLCAISSICGHAEVEHARHDVRDSDQSKRPEDGSQQHARAQRARHQASTSIR